MQVLLNMLFRFLGKNNSAIDFQVYCIHGANFALLAIVKSQCLDHVANVGNVHFSQFLVLKHRKFRKVAETPDNGRYAKGMAAYEAGCNDRSHP